MTRANIARHTVTEAVRTTVFNYYQLTRIWQTW